MSGRARPTVISMFSGCGGSSLGYAWAGYDELLAVDFDKKAMGTFRRNFPGTSSMLADIKTLSVDQVREMAGIIDGELDILDGSPPCQGFSISNTKSKRDVNDPRNDLYVEFVRMIRGLRPRMFLIENVKGMIIGRMKGRFREIMKELKLIGGYGVRARILNSMYYQVPQSRERVIIIGVRDDLLPEHAVEFPNMNGGIDIYPKPSQKKITVAEAIDRLDLASPKSELFAAVPPSAYGLLPYIKPGQSFQQTPLNNRPAYMFNLVRLPKDRPAPTIRATGATSQYFHYAEDRVLDIEELKALCSFPRKFQFEGRYNAGRQLGNAVMPKFMQAIAARLRDVLEKGEAAGKPTAPDRTAVRRVRQRRKAG